MMNGHNAKHTLHRPTNLTITQIVDKVKQHYSSDTDSASRLPVLATHSLMSMLVQEIKRYKGCAIAPLKHCIDANNEKDLIADIQIVGADNLLLEGYVVKHNVPISSDLIQTSFEKFRTTSVRRFYILTTYHHDSYTEFEPDIQRVAREHGCQLIVNGVYPTLRYYLRLIGNTDEFVAAYAANLETDPSVTYRMKEAWNEIAAS